MKVYAINGGPRKHWNTATMLEHFLQGAASAGGHVRTELIHLYDYKYTGCTSCFSCQRGGAGRGKCAVKDDIHDLLRDVPLADVVAFGSPVYFHDITAQLRAFLERLFYQFASFDGEIGSLAPRALPSAMIYTMNVSEEVMRMSRYEESLGRTEQWFGRIFSVVPERLYAFNTYQFNNYHDYKVSYWNEHEKAEWREKRFPLDCRAAFETGRKMAERAG